MATMNGRYIKVELAGGSPLDGETIGVVRDWRQESDWMMVHLLDGSRVQIHYTDKFDVLPANYKP